MSSKKQIAHSIIHFLNESLNDGTVKQDDREGLEVATQCIAEAFGVNEDSTSGLKHIELQAIFDTYIQSQDKVPVVNAPSLSEKAQAEELKNSGNTQMSQKTYDLAVDSYTQAIALDSSNPVYFSNRSAAYACKGDYFAAAMDAEKAIELDSSFVKGYGRLGHAKYALGDYKSSAAAFQKGLELDPKNGNMISGLQNAQNRIKAGEDALPSANTSASGSNEPLQANTASSNGGGDRDMASSMSNILNNPMMMQAAEQMMANGGLDKLMSNPAFANMMNRVQGGNMPSMEELMEDPALRNLANQFRQ